MREIIFGLDLTTLKPGSVIEHMGKKGTITYIDTKLLDQQTGYPVILVNWEDKPFEERMKDWLESPLTVEELAGKPVVALDADPLAHHGRR